jgi:adenylate cyclase
VTIVFADLSGFTSIAERRPRTCAFRTRCSGPPSPVDARSTASSKFVGDAVMAVFGAPVAHGDDPARALERRSICSPAARSADWALGSAARHASSASTDPVVAGSLGVAAGAPMR